MRLKKEKIRLCVTVRQGTCAVCRMEPRAEHLDLTLSHKKHGIYKVTLCRDCLAEHMPEFLGDLEDAYDRD